jgi:7-carboxy-7-deazaguanine synthase
MAPSDILDRVEQLSGGSRVLITLSGGNPAIHNFGPLIRAGHVRGHIFAIETQGTIAPAWLREVGTVTISPKPPSSKMITDWEKLDRVIGILDVVLQNVSLKVVAFDEDDYLYAREVARRYPGLPFYLQVGTLAISGEAPVRAYRAQVMADYCWLAQRALADRWFTVTILPQLHVLAWGGKRGV